MGSLHHQRNNCQNIHLVRGDENCEGDEEMKVGGVREEGDEKQGGRRGKEEREKKEMGGKGGGREKGGRRKGEKRYCIETLIYVPCLWEYKINLLLH